MAVTIISKVASSNAYATNEKPADMSPRMLENFGGLTPITTILNRIAVARRARNVRVDWTESEEIPTQVQHTGIDESGSGNTSITVADWQRVGLGDILFVPRTKERLRVDAIVNSTTVSVTRGIGDSSEANILAGELLEKTSTAAEEATTAIVSRAVVNTNQYNYNQIIREFVETSRDANAEWTEFGGPGTKRMENFNKLWRMFRIQHEKGVMFGARSIDTSTGSYDIRTMGGLIQWLATGTNVFTVDGLLTESALDNWLVDVWTEMPDTQVLTLFAAPHLINIINQIAKPLIRLSPNTKIYGMQLNQYMGAVKVDLVPCPLLKGLTLKGWGFLLDLNKVAIKYLRPAILSKDVGLRSDDQIRDMIDASATMMVQIEKNHGFIEDVTG